MRYAVKELYRQIGKEEKERKERARESELEVSTISFKHTVDRPPETVDSLS